MATEEPLYIRGLMAKLHKTEFLLLALVAGVAGTMLIIFKDRTAFPEISRDIGIALLAAGTTAIGVEFFTQKTFRKLVNKELQDQLVVLRSELRFARNASRLKDQTSISACLSDDGFRKIFEAICSVQASVLEKLADGIISVPLELGVAMHSEMMNHFHLRMDAVSFRDLDFWSHIDEPATPHPHRADADFGRRYYESIRSFKKRKKTVVTRIFVLEQKEVTADMELLARIIKRHMEDKIGVAVAFLDNFDPQLKEWYGASSGPRKDFALLNTNEATTVFRHGTGGRYEALCRCAGKGNEIDKHRSLHKTLIVASMLGSQDFQEQVRGAYTAAEWDEMLGTISDLRSKKDRKPSDSIFAVVLPQLNADIDEIKGKIKAAIQESKSFGPLIGKS